MHPEPIQWDENAPSIRFLTDAEAAAHFAQQVQRKLKLPIEQFITQYRNGELPNSCHNSALMSLLLALPDSVLHDDDTIATTSTGAR